MDFRKDEKDSNKDAKDAAKTATYAVRLFIVLLQSFASLIGHKKRQG